MPEIATEKKLTPAQRRAIESLLTTGNMTKAAEASNVHRSTLYKWMKEEPFADALQEAEQEAVAALSRSLAGLGELAGDALRDALAPGVKITIRLRAAEIVTDRLLKIRELVEIEERVRLLEEAAKHANS